VWTQIHRNNFFSTLNQKVNQPCPKCQTGKKDRVNVSLKIVGSAAIRAGKLQNNPSLK